MAGATRNWIGEQNSSIFIQYLFNVCWFLFVMHFLVLSFALFFFILYANMRVSMYVKPENICMRVSMYVKPENICC